MEKLFNDLPRSSGLQHMLYNDRASVGLNEFLGRVSTIISEKGPWDNKEVFEKTLSYLLPLLKEGKLKVIIREYDKEPEGIEARRKYFNEMSTIPAEESIKLIREKWNSFTSMDECSNWEQYNVAFTLPENEWI